MSRSERDKHFRILENMYSGSFLEFLAEAQYPKKIYEYRDCGLTTKNVNSHDPHEEVVYYINKDGFPGRDFIQNAEILALGCSVTAGIGVGSSNTWSWMVEANTEMSVNQLGISGASTQILLSAFLEFVEKYGKPKYLLALIPEARRQWVFVEEKPYRARYSFEDRSKTFLSHESRQGIRSDIRGSKIDYDVTVQNYYSAISDMSRVCSIMGIKFLFFSYTDEENDRFKDARTKGFLDKGMYSATRIDPNQCARHRNSGVAFWHRGVDIPPHPGLHEHIHYAELFIAGIKDKSL